VPAKDREQAGDKQAGGGVEATASPATESAKDNEPANRPE
jgi:hypothetical protein